mgnify:CR=1 FL=1
MDNVMQFLFNTNHEQPSIPVWILLIVIAVVIPNYARYRMEQKHSNDSVPTQNPARSCPAQEEAQQEALSRRLGQHGKDALLFHDLP